MEEVKGHTAHKRYCRKLKARPGRIVVTDRDSPLFDEMHYWNTCKSKTGFATEWQAKYDADRAFEERGSNLTWYRCPYCGLWHLTSN